MAVLGFIAAVWLGFAVLNIVVWAVSDDEKWDKVDYISAAGIACLFLWLGLTS